MLHRLGLGRGSSNDASSGSLRADLYSTEGPIGMKILVEPLYPIVEYVPSSINAINY